MNTKFGFDRLVAQVTEVVASRVSLWTEGAQRHGSGSPIERLLYLAVAAQAEFGEHCEFWRINIARDDATLSDLMSGADAYKTLIIQREVTLDRIGRVDFIFHAYGQWTIETGARGWRRLIVECDGHNFHERTREQAAKDRSRDRTAALLGYEVFRFTGSELWRDPWGCAGQIFTWADRGV